MLKGVKDTSKPSVITTTLYNRQNSKQLVGPRPWYCALTREQLETSISCTDPSTSLPILNSLSYDFKMPTSINEFSRQTHQGKAEFHGHHCSLTHPVRHWPIAMGPARTQCSVSPRDMLTTSSYLDVCLPRMTAILPESTFTQDNRGRLCGLNSLGPRLVDRLPSN